MEILKEIVFFCKCLIFQTKAVSLCVILNVMKRTKYTLLPRLTKILEGLGEDIKMARLRRKLSAAQVAERAGVSRTTLWQIEKGLPNVSMGYYAQVLFVLGLENNLAIMAADDALGRKLQDAEILVRKRAPKRKILKDEQ
jgi:transcriptional regulator with XRE-family HTH domain